MTAPSCSPSWRRNPGASVRQSSSPCWLPSGMTSSSRVMCADFTNGCRPTARARSRSRSPTAPKPKIGDSRPAPAARADPDSNEPTPARRRRRRGGRGRSAGQGGGGGQGGGERRPSTPVQALLVDDNPLELDDDVLETRRG